MIVVGVDGSDRNRSAVSWASEEAALRGDHLVLATAVEEGGSASRSLRAAARYAVAALDVAARARDAVGSDQVTTATVEGRPERLVEAFPDADLLVVGKRGLGTLPRLVVGSTSLALAGRSPIPVVVVPEHFEPVGHGRGPVVVGVDPEHPVPRLLEAGFERAQRLGVPLVAVHGWEAPSVPPDTAAQLERESHDAFEELMDGWAKRFPEVDLRTVASGTHPALAVLDASADAQLVMLGRRSTSRFSGFGFGSVTRAVLHYAECPVLVVPAAGA